MKFLTKGALLAAPMLALAAPAFAQVTPVPDPTLNNSELPGSVIIFPKFVTGLVNVDGNTFNRTEIELGAVCPAGLTCLENTKVKVRLHWVCPGAEGVNSNICNEQDFEITTLTVNGKVVIDPDGVAINAGNPAVPAAPCARGYLIAWVENTADQPVKFDALIGNAVIRGPNNAGGPAGIAGFSTAVSAYMAIPIQANLVDPVANPPVGGPVAPVLAQPLVFDGASGHYQRLTDVQVADVRFDKPAPGAPLPNILSNTALVFLTVDVQSGLPNNPIFVPLSFYNEKEVLTSIDGYEFVCWDQPSLAFLDGGTGNLGQAFQTTRKGIVIAGPANKVQTNVGDPNSGPATLIGLVETNEGSVANVFTERKYNFNMSEWCVNTIGAGGQGTCPLDSTVVQTTVVTSTTFVP
ncbi:MAG: hypothetical protein JO081_14905 [Alphaproteobacteria bacterium]|nr:hypothetical protein [Alphaproteobacteria bacterium]